MSFRKFVALLGAVIVASVPTTGAFAIDNPIPGVDIVVKKNPGGIVVAKTQTDAKGQVVLKDLLPGSYTVDLEGKSLVAASTKGRPPVATASPKTTTADGKSRVAVADANNDGAAPVIAIIATNLLPASKVDPNPQVHREKATPRGVQMNLTVPAGASGAATKQSFTITVTIEQ